MERNITECKREVFAQIDEISGDLRKVSKKIYDNPELKFEEYKAVSWLTEELENRHFSVNKGVGGLETAFQASFPAEEPSPKIAYLCEYDALPELGHACGHNLIAGIGLGAGIGLSSVINGIEGTVQVIGTPAEEGGGGKVQLVEAGIFDDLDAAMMVHPSDRTVVGKESLAIQEVQMDFYGEPSHAAAEPEKGINALDAAICTFNNINAFREHMREGSRIHGIITDGGRKPNIVPAHAGALFYVRATKSEYLGPLVDRVKKCGKAGALASGAEVEFSEAGHSYQPLKPNSVLGGLFKQNLIDLGVPVDSQYGGMGSTDMGDVSQKVPAIHPYIRIAETGTPAHSHSFAEASNSKRGYQAMITAAKALAATGVELLMQEEWLDKMWEEFAESS